MNDAKQCPWCQRWCLKDDACNYIFACGLQSGNLGFLVGGGCGKSWCWQCGKKFCGQYVNPQTGMKYPNASDTHNDSCCTKESDFSKETYCCGGHNSHCDKRW
jgi:hypothetical protein